MVTPADESQYFTGPGVQDREGCFGSDGIMPLPLVEFFQALVYRCRSALLSYWIQAGVYVKAAFEHPVLSE
jgi:hypothetical protein